MANQTANPETHEQAANLRHRQAVGLAHRHHVLEDRVAELTRRLAAARTAAHEQALENERIGDRMACLLEALPAAIVILDGNGIIRECNSRAIALLGIPLAGVAWSVVVQREFCRGKSRDGDLRLKSGRWLSLSRQPLAGEPGEILLLADITESRRNASLLDRADRLASIGEMTARLGHQIRTPLASALLYASQLEQGAGDSQRAAIASINRRLRELGGMVDDMLSFAGGATPAGDRVRVADLLKEVAETIAPQLTSGSRIKIEMADPALELFANFDALKGALLNLVSNSMQACSEKPVIELSAVMSRDRVCLTVSDNGCGIAEDIRRRVFEPFFTTRPQGTGLGLAVVRSVAEAHGGEVLLQDAECGTSISICIPVSRPANDSRGDATNE